MIKDLIKIADRLDAMGLSEEANFLDKLIKKSSDSFEKRNIDEVVSRFKNSSNPDLWSSVEPNIYNIIKAPNNPESLQIKEMYPGWETKDFIELYSRMGEELDLVGSDFLLLLRNHFDPNSPYQMSKTVLSKVTEALHGIYLKYNELEESDIKALEEKY